MSEETREGNPEQESAIDADIRRNQWKNCLSCLFIASLFLGLALFALTRCAQM